MEKEDLADRVHQRANDNQGVETPKREIVLTSVHFFHTGYADMHIENMYRCIESYSKCGKSTSLLETSRLNCDLEVLNASMDNTRSVSRTNEIG